MENERIDKTTRTWISFRAFTKEQLANSVSVLPKCARLQDESLFRNYSLFHSPTYRSSRPRHFTFHPPTVLFRSHFATLPSQLHLLEPSATAESYIEREWKGNGTRRHKNWIVKNSLKIPTHAHGKGDEPSDAFQRKPE